MTPTRTPVTEQDPKVRARNFDEVTLGYTLDEAIKEANRCLNCKNKPCTNGCPVSVRIPEFIAKVAEGKFEELKAKADEAMGDAADTVEDAAEKVEEAAEDFIEE